MADVGEQGYEYEQYSPQTNGRLFSSSMFGFNKEEVLEYLDELADENYQRQEASERQIQELSQRLSAFESNTATQQDNAHAATQEAEGERQRANMLLEELEIMRAATQQAEDDLARTREQFENSRQENAWLREEYEKNEAHIADLRRQLDELSSETQWVDDSEKDERIAELERRLREALNTPSHADTTEKDNQITDLRRRLDQALAALAEQKRAAKATPSSAASVAIIADANAEADRIRAVAIDERERLRRQIRSSAGGLAESIGTLRGDLTGVESDVSRVLESVQDSLSDVLSALSRTEQNLNTFGVQVDRFPQSAAPVPKAPQQQVVYFQPGTQPVAPERTAPRSQPRASSEGLGRSSFQRVLPSQAGASNTRPFRPTHSTASKGAYWPQAVAEAWPEEDPGEERIRTLAENLVETLVEMLR